MMGEFMSAIRRLAAVVAIFVLSLSSALAGQGACPSAISLSPDTQGAVSSPALRWTGEPNGTASREVVLISVVEGPGGSVAPAGEQSREAAEAFRHAPGRLGSGVYNWFVIFYSEDGKVLCNSAVARFGIGARAAQAGTASLSSTVSVQVRGYYVVVLFNSPYLQTTGAYDTLVNQNDYNASALDMARYLGVKLYGNDAANLLTGSAGADIIFGYAGNDTLNGGEGADILNGGDESCSGPQCTIGGALGGTLNGGEGDDILTGGDEFCAGGQCGIGARFGDTLNGGGGDDTLNGGNEYCTDSQCGFSAAFGDTLNGEDGDDTLNGGNESCDGGQCGIQARIGDTLNAGADNDTLNGGDERCFGGQCGIDAAIGDTLDGGPGDDTGSGGSESSDQGGTLGDTITPDANDTVPITQN
jgi:RTX calcium-binding nonapeptide repeat (4 copies)